MYDPDFAPGDSTDYFDDGEVQTIAFDYKPLQWQATVHEMWANVRFFVLIAARRSGKTTLACNTIIKRALELPDTRHVFAAPTRVLARQTAWSELRRICAKVAPDAQFRESELRIVFSNGSDVLLLGAETADTQARGLDISTLILDEASFVDIDTFYSVFRPALASTNGVCLISGTPQSPADLLGHCFHYANNSGDPEWAAFQIDAYAAGNLAIKEIEAWRRQVGEDQFAREGLADVSRSADNVFIPQVDTQAAMDRVAPHNMHRTLTGQPKVIGVDCAGDGSDKTVIARLWGSVMLPFITLDGGVEGNQRAAARLVDEIRTFEPDAIYVDGGGGYHSGLMAVVRDALGYPLTAVNFGSKAVKDDLFYNRRAEMHSGLRDWLRRPDSVLPNDRNVLTDFSATRFELDPKGRIKLEKKSDVKMRISRSPDRADAAALCFAIPHARLNPQHAQQSWDPSLRGTVSYGAAGCRYYRKDPGLAARRRGNEFDPFAGTWGDQT